MTEPTVQPGTGPTVQPGTGPPHEPLSEPSEQPLSESGSEQEVADRLAERLLQAHRRVRTAVLSPDDKVHATRRLIALTDASKHDVARAASRLDALLADLDAGRVTPE